MCDDEHVLEAMNEYYFLENRSKTILYQCIGTKGRNKQEDLQEFTNLHALCDLAVSFCRVGVPYV